MKRIFKYEIELREHQKALLPDGARFLSCQLQRDVICLWAVVDPGARHIERTIHIVGTGHEVPDLDLIHLGTVQQSPYVWHVFIVRAHFVA